MKYKVQPLVKARQDQRITVADFAKQVGVSEDWIYKIERGEAQPSEKLIFRMSEVLDIPISKLRSRAS